MNSATDSDSSVPPFQRIATQIRSAIAAGEAVAGERLPDIRQLASDHGCATSTVEKALHQLEAQGLVEKRSGGFVIGAATTDRYRSRGVSPTKAEVHEVVERLDQGLFPGAFCKITEDVIGGDPDRCNVIHSDGSGSKSIIGYLQYRETGDAGVFRGIAQDSVVMNIDDLLCVGATGRILLSSTINRNAVNCPGEVVAALIEGTEAFLAQLREWGVQVYGGGGETADVGDLTGTVVVDSCAVTVMQRQQVITGERITPGLAIVGLASDGQTHYEERPNSGIGSNGLTSARHDLLHRDYAERYPESFDPQLDPSLVYGGPWHLEDPLPGTDMSVAEALLSPTRSYAPLVRRLLHDAPEGIRALIHCSGGGQTKCLRFGRGIRFVKDALFEPPPVFLAIQQASATRWQEMYQVYNMGHRMEVYCEPSAVAGVIETADSFGIAAKVVGRTEAGGAANTLRIESSYGRFDYGLEGD